MGEKNHDYHRAIVLHGKMVFQLRSGGLLIFIKICEFLQFNNCWVFFFLPIKGHNGLDGQKGQPGTPGIKVKTKSEYLYFKCRRYSHS